MGSLRTAGLFVLVLALAAAFRFPLLAQRPMHCDESVLAAKTGILLETNRYEYDPQEFHGPTLHHLTLIAARIQGVSRYVDLGETTLRAVPAVLGLLLVAAHFLMIPVLGRNSAVFAALLAAISPAMVYYSRYYIHETLFVLLSFGALISFCRYLRNKTFGWAIAAGVFLGLMQATKETSVIVFGSLLAAWFLCLAFKRWRGETDSRASFLMNGRHLLTAALVAAAVSLLLYSSFLSHPRGIIDSLLAYRNYFERAVSDSPHTHPWHYYLQMLLFFRLNSGPIWTEGMILGLAICGLAAGLSRNCAGKWDQRPVRFLGFYSLLMIVFYAAIPYKTPWCVLGSLHGMILLAGVGAVRLFHSLRKPALQSLFLAVLAAAATHLGWQARRGSLPMDADPANPYVYAHTTRDVFAITRQVESLASTHPDGTSMPIQVVSRENLWPLPWYLRRFTHVGWWKDLSDDVPNAPVILVTPDMEPLLARKLYELPPPGQRELYINIFDRPIQLRPRVEIRGYAAKTLWDDYLRRLPLNTPSQSPDKLGQSRP
jgi:uncharacterized protein (TIGR03663 family)